MTKKLLYGSISAFLSIVSLLSTFQYPAMAQSALRPQQTHLRRAAQPVSLAHLYWHFLEYQNHLDTRAAAISAEGKNGSGMRHILQRNLGFSDANFASIRASSVRLTAKVKALDRRAAVIRAGDPSSSNLRQLKALTIERETDINVEISSLKQNLSPAKIAALEAFLTNFFSPNNAVSRPLSPATASASTVVDK